MTSLGTFQFFSPSSKDEGMHLPLAFAETLIPFFVIPFKAREFK